MTDAAAWLAPRLADAPTALRERMIAHVEATAVGGDVATHLAEAAVAALAVALEHGDERAGAYELLAADALLTHVIEAAAEAPPGAAASLLEKYGPAGLEARVAAASAS